MKVLLIGSGGREHALAWKIAQSPLSRRLVCAPGNPGMEKLAEIRPVKATDVAGLVALAFEGFVGGECSATGEQGERTGGQEVT